MITEAVWDHERVIYSLQTNLQAEAVFGVPGFRAHACISEKFV